VFNYGPSLSALNAENAQLSKSISECFTTLLQRENYAVVAIVARSWFGLQGNGFGVLIGTTVKTKNYGTI
jgi:hypothetical protein